MWTTKPMQARAVSYAEKWDTRPKIAQIPNQTNPTSSYCKLE